VPGVVLRVRDRGFLFGLEDAERLGNQLHDAVREMRGFITPVIEDTTIDDTT